MVLGQANSDNPRMYDLSFMYTKRCNLACSFCMYNSEPNVTENMDLAALRSWLATVDYSLIASFGAYGGEPSVDLEGWSAIFDMLPKDRPTFVITNGSWSTDWTKTQSFLRFCAKYRMHVVVSGTPEHRRYQNRQTLDDLKEEQPDAFTLKPVGENFHAMGRLAGRMPFSCSRKCSRWNRALRIAVQPDGTIIYQNCDGVYPVVGNISEPFSAIDNRVQSLRRDGFAAVCPHF